jgi:ADP-ribose pyrophosphatase
MKSGKKRDLLFEPVQKRERVYAGSYLNLDRLTIRLPNGKKAFREIVNVRNAVAILPVDRDGTVYLVRQHRPAIKRTIIEIPAGVVDGKTESLEKCARRECEEETGIVPGKLLRLLTYSHAEGYSTGFITLFLATHLKHTGKLNLDQTEFVEQVKMPFDKLIRLIEKGVIFDSKTILGAILAMRYLIQPQCDCH